MQKTILKDNIVKNVIELDEDTIIVDKATHKKISIQEESEYQIQLETWNAIIEKRKSDIYIVSKDIGMANMTLAALKMHANTEEDDSKAALALRQILSLEVDISERERTLDAIKSGPFPAKPILIRGKRWFHPDGFEVGPDGGNIGDVWDGEKYNRSEKID